MQHAAEIRGAIDFMEQNLREEILAEDVARAVNFSTSHFHAIFHRATGCTVKEHLRKRRLSAAAIDLALSRRSILDIAVEYRFDSQEAFTRAFKRRYGITPGLFRRNRAHAAVAPRLGIYAPAADRLLRREAPAPAAAAPCDRQERRLLLSGVPRVGFALGADRCPEDIPFPACMAAALRFLGEEYPWLPLEAHGRIWRLNYANVHMLGATGMAFGLLWRPGWQQDNVDMMFLADPREIIDRAFRAAGYRYEIIAKTGEAEVDEATYREQVRTSLRRGRPVLAFGLIGPPECCLITGYDEDGDVVMGWNFFASEPAWRQEVTCEPTGEFRRRDWVRSTHSLVIIGDRCDPGFDLRETLAWALHVARTPSVMGRHAGFAAYDAWATHILDDDAFPADDAAVLTQRHEVHFTESGNLAECRAWAGQFLRYLAPSVPAVTEELLAAGDCYTAEHDLMWQMWEITGEPRQAHLRFASRDVRRRTAALIGKARQLDERAAGYLEQALSRLR
ncbi:MAG: rob 3 [Symbiobacteriaceae bacterium]|jgi:AraC-like DNA-binding protein|nr:rob 3 [Symbiobacteriaceae bacterium]